MYSCFEKDGGKLCPSLCASNVVCQKIVCKMANGADSDLGRLILVYAKNEIFQFANGIEYT